MTVSGSASRGRNRILTFSPSRAPVPRSDPAAYQRMSPVSPGSSSRRRRFAFLLARRYRAGITAVAALQLLHRQPISPAPPLRGRHFAQTFGWRNESISAQMSEGAIRFLDVLAAAPL